MTGSREPYDDHLEQFGRSLRRAAIDHEALRPPARRPLIAAGGVVAVVAAVLGFVIAAPGGGGPVDVVGRAQAALNGTGKVVHYAFFSASGPAVGTGLDIQRGRANCEQSGPTQVWQTTNPVQWRMLRPGLVPSKACTGGGKLKPTDGTTEIAYADRAVTQYTVDDNTLSTITDYSSVEAASRILLGSGQPGDQEPLVTLRRMLADGSLVDRGERTLDGRRVRTLSGDEPSSTFRVGGVDHEMRSQLIYHVDAETFVPVRMIRISGLPQIAHDKDGLRMTGTKPYAYQVDFERYERLPKDDQTSKLLTITPTGSPKRTTITQAELRERIDRESTGVDASVTGSEPTPPVE